MVYLTVIGFKGFSFDKLFTYCNLPRRSNGYKLKESLSSQC